MDVFTPSMLVWPYKRSGDLAPVLETPFESGSVQRRARWTKGPLEVSYKFRGHQDELDVDYAFMLAKGQHTAFKFKDKLRYSVTAETLGVGDGITLIFYTDWPLVDNDNLSIMVDGVVQALTTDYTVDDPMENGKITFEPASVPDMSEVVTATYEYYRKMYFNFDTKKGPEVSEVAPYIWEMEVQMIEVLT